MFLGAIAVMRYHFAVVTVQYSRLGDTEEDHVREIPGAGAGNSRRDGLMTAAIIGFLGAGCLFDAAYNGNFLSKSVAVQIGITAHRGYSSEAPENTMAALEAAVEAMADVAEIDVQETKDGYVVLCHDADLQRTAGIRRAVADMTLGELTAVDVGGWFSAEYAGEPVPTLREVMEYAKGKIDLNIELKNMGNNSALPKKVLELVREYDMMTQCIVTSTNPRYLKRLKELEPELRTGYILSAVYGRSYDDESIDVISIRSDFVNARMVERAHEAGKAVHAWTVNTKMELERLRALSVDNVITDDPVLAREILYREEATETLLEYLRMLLR